MMTPTIVPADVSGVFALLALVADPKATKKRLEELAEATAKAEKATQEASAANTKAAEDRAIAEKAASEATNTLIAFRKESEAKTAELDKREQNVKDAEARLAERQQAFGTQSSQKSGELHTRERKVADDEKRLKGLIAAAEEKVRLTEIDRLAAAEKLARINAAAA